MDKYETVILFNFYCDSVTISGVVYGNGAYFARNASYSVRFTQPDHKGYRCLYVAKVLVGKYTTGSTGMKAPPSRNDPSNPGLLYDSVVDNMNNPGIFVIFLDHQCYPEYLITFQWLHTKIYSAMGHYVATSSTWKTALPQIPVVVIETC